MTTLSTRYAVPLLVLLALALAPVAHHALVDRTLDDCADPAALLDTTAIEGSTPSHQHDTGRWSLIQWTQGDVDTRGLKIPAMRYHVVRSFEPARLALGPTETLVTPINFSPARLRWVEADGERLPVHSVYVHSWSGSRVATYLFAYGDRAVENPFGAGLGNAISQLWSGTQPLTLFVIDGAASPKRVVLAEQRQVDWLVAAWQRYREVCIR